MEELCTILFNLKKEGREEGKKGEERRGGDGGGWGEEKKREKAKDRQRQLS